MEGTEDAATIDFGHLDAEIPKKPTKHPIAVACHLGFRSLAILVYLLCRFFTDSFVSSFVSVLLLLSVDFWTVKNVTGRLLVGLRWWNYVDDAGQSHWVFESRKDGDSSEAGIFWVALVASPVLWGLFLFISIFTWSFQWAMVCTIALCLNGANLYGYIRCRLGSKSSISSAASNFFGRQFLKGVFSGGDAARQTGT